jgi:predicted dehydrogenase
MKRRTFIRQSALGATGAGLTTILPFSTSFGRNSSAADKVNVALIGCRNMGFGVLNHAMTFEDVNCVALCDVDENVLNQRAAELATNYNSKPKHYKDFRKLLEQKDIDAVIIGTPDHWHCLQTIYACQAGKDVYVEKPMANTIGECNLMVKASRKYTRIIQVGQQQRSSPIFIKAMELIKNQQIGKLRKVNIWANFNYGVGNPIVSDTPVPAGVDYDMWLGPAPKRPFNQNRFHGSWRHFWDYGGGLASDWGVHLIDMALWAKDLVAGPKEVLTYAANTFAEPRARETFDTMSISFPKNDFVINYDLTAGVQRGPWDQPYGLAFIGDKGTLVINRNYLEIFPEWDDQQKINKTEPFKMEQADDTHKLHVRNFIDCVKSRKVPVCPPEIGRATALHTHVANISARVGQPHLLWNDEKNQFENSKEANALIMPEYRKPWTLPTV